MLELQGNHHRDTSLKEAVGFASEPSQQEVKGGRASPGKLARWGTDSVHLVSKFKHIKTHQTLIDIKSSTSRRKT